MKAIWKFLLLPSTARTPLREASGAQSMERARAPSASRRGRVCGDPDRPATQKHLTCGDAPEPASATPLGEEG